VLLRRLFHLLTNEKENDSVDDPVEPVATTEAPVPGSTSTVPATIPPTVTLDSESLEVIAFNMQVLSRQSKIKTFFIGVLVVVALVSTSGWWASSQDKATTEKYVATAACRSQELAETLSLFATIVAPEATEAERDQAGHTLDAMPSLSQRYINCAEDPTGHGE
jgi:hypothetical protein